MLRGDVVVLDPEQQSRQQYFGRYISKKSRGLEFGPSYRPTFPKRDGWRSQSVDHASRTELVQKYFSELEPYPHLIEQIEEVDFIFDGDVNDDISVLPQSLDYVVACHVLEHVPDLLNFLRDVASLLKNGGYFFLAIPSRSLCFDFYRPLSTLGDVIACHLAPDIYARKAFIDSRYFHANLYGKSAWTSEELTQETEEKPQPTSNEEDIGPLLKEYFSNEPRGMEYIDFHRWVFEEATLSDILEKLRQARLSEFNIVETAKGVGCEFLMVLKKEPKKSSPKNGSAGGRMRSLPFLHSLN